MRIAPPFFFLHALFSHVLFIRMPFFSHAFFFACSFFSPLPCCTLKIITRFSLATPAVSLALYFIFLRTYPAAPLFYFSTHLPCCALIFQSARIPTQSLTKFEHISSPPSVMHGVPQKGQLTLIFVHGTLSLPFTNYPSIKSRSDNSLVRSQASFTTLPKPLRYATPSFHSTHSTW